MNDPKVPKLAPTLLAAAFNLAPIIGVLFWGWSAFALIFLYWLENVVIGLRTLAGILANAIASRDVGALGALFIAGFFALHYGLFCFGHGSFLVALFGGAARGDSIFDLAGTAQSLFAERPELVFGLVSIVLWQALQFVLFLVRGEVRTANPLALMGAPYARIIVLHVTILIGGFVLLAFNQPVFGLLILALVKMGFDIAEARGLVPALGGMPRPANQP